MPELPYIPETITVHLGPPDASVPNVTVSFPDYIKNVASSEIYPTWPENALRANIYAQISYALNRIYTEYYRSRGYDFDISNSTAIDQSFVNGRDIFENVSQIVDEIFNDYLRRPGNIEPLFAQYCSGTTVTCPGGLSQWGSVDLANRGYTPYQILTYYYGDNLDIVTNAPVQGITESLPPYPLRLGSTGDDVRTIQIRLNRISRNYPSIPKIADTNGFFSYDTEAAVRQFQEIFNLTPDGIIGRATWYRIQSIYNGIKRLNSLNSEGISPDEVTGQFPSVLQEGDTGVGVRELQYYLSYLAQFINEIPPVTIDGVFGPATASAVRAAQAYYGLTPDGIVGVETWRTLYFAYRGILDVLPPGETERITEPYDGIPLVIGAESDRVRLLQEYLNVIAEVYPEIPTVNVTGLFGAMTEEAVTAFQRQFGLPPSGRVAASTWNAVTSVYEDIVRGNQLREGQFPGFTIE